MIHGSNGLPLGPLYAIAQSVNSILKKERGEIEEMMKEERIGERGEERREVAIMMKGRKI